MGPKAATVDYWRYLGVEDKGRKAKLRLVAVVRHQPEALIRAHLKGPVGTVSAYAFRAESGGETVLSFPAFRVRPGEHFVELEVDDGRIGVFTFNVTE
jgi:hypothetical protein